MRISGSTEKAAGMLLLSISTDQVAEKIFENMLGTDYQINGPVSLIGPCGEKFAIWNPSTQLSFGPFGVISPPFPFSIGLQRFHVTL